MKIRFIGLGYLSAEDKPKGASQPEASSSNQSAVLAGDKTTRVQTWLGITSILIALIALLVAAWSGWSDMITPAWKATASCLMVTVFALIPVSHFLIVKKGWFM